MCEGLGTERIMDRTERIMDRTAHTMFGRIREYTSINHRTKISIFGAGKILSRTNTRGEVS
jgi:hypothetical protein